MSYNDEAAKAKLSALNETQESIVTVAQWFLFHRRHADTTARLWLQRLKDSGSGKRLNLVYLANEVVQQSKARKKDDFFVAFSPIIAEATAVAFKGATNEVQQKLRRVVEVWRQRAIFDPAVQEAVEAKVEEVDRGRAGIKKAQLGGSLFSSGASSTVPTEIAPLVPSGNALSRAELAVKPAISTADSEYNALNDVSKSSLSLPVHAARLSALVKSLANAENAVTECMKARRSLIEELEKLLELNRKSLTEEAEQKTDIETKKNAIEAKRREVEDGIMRGLSSGDIGAADTTTTVRDESSFERPEYEALTPPPVESTTPPDIPPDLPLDLSETWPSEVGAGRPSYEDITPPPASPSSNIPQHDPRKRPSASSPIRNGSTGNDAVDANVVAIGSKRRKRSGGDEDNFGGFGEGDAMEGLDHDVVASLG